MTLEEFRTSLRAMTPAEYTDAYGHSEVADSCEPGDTLAVYHGGTWIIRRPDGSHYLMLEASEYDTRDGKTLGDLERILWEWQRADNDDEREQRQERLDTLARAMMATRPDLQEMSLDEWLHQHHDKLSDNEKRAATWIIELHSERYDAD
ncbi:hypothetical protein [Paracoccus litorisediminis]|uniref:Uncharacterized protein n=1 Tax=Paracoccus litorisediminis TaxID=2006130 RepID=A0A844HQN4_9RHOB|nr:hypothetical protein [Paracoccus litorisediminis]MTH62156.1 hypothetical protein [Paracoccus litorisediminis]